MQVDDASSSTSAVRRAFHSSTCVGHANVTYPFTVSCGRAVSDRSQTSKQAPGADTVRLSDDMRASRSTTGRAGKDSCANRVDVGADTETEPATDLEAVRVDYSGRTWTPGTSECAGNIVDAVH